MPDIPHHLREAVTRRAAYCCEYCRSQEAYSPDAFSIEHIHPRSRGGATTLANLALSCQGCNGHKATRIASPDPQTGAMAPLFHPRLQNWHEHFAWSADFTLVSGLTPTGRAAIAALQLNRTRLLTLRGALQRIGAHPPAE